MNDFAAWIDPLTTVTFTYTRRRGQHKRDYKNEAETIEVSDQEIEAMRSASGTAGATRNQLAVYAADQKRQLHAGGRRCVATVS